MEQKPHPLYPNTPAFNPDLKGITKLEYFCAAALQGLMASQATLDGQAILSAYEAAVQMVDLINAKSKN